MKTTMIRREVCPACFRLQGDFDFHCEEKHTCEHCGERARMLTVYEAIGRASAEVWILRREIANLRREMGAPCLR